MGTDLGVCTHRQSLTNTNINQILYISFSEMQSSHKYDRKLRLKENLVNAISRCDELVKVVAEIPTRDHNQAMEQLSCRYSDDYASDEGHHN